MPVTSAGATEESGASPRLSADSLALFELQKPFVEPLLRMFRLTNTALDVLFYDVGKLTDALHAKGTEIDTGASSATASREHPLQKLNLTAQTNPSGCVIVVDANSPPYVFEPYRDMEAFFAFANHRDNGLRTLAITGVGSSAYGSVAFAWNVSKALHEPVAAVVPGYGLADVIPQALGGWFGFEMYGPLQTVTQNFLARFTPALALLPLFVLWFGSGEGSKVLLIATSVAVVTLLGAHQGVRGVPRVYLDAAAALGASPGLAFRKITLPAALPHIFASLRIGLGLAWVTIVVAELIDARMPSLGYLLTLAGAYPRVPTMVVGIATIGALVLAFDLLAMSMHARATRWMRRTA